MPVEITGKHPPEHRLQPGEVVMVRRRLRDKQSKKPFDWTFFAIITRHVHGILYEMMILDEKQREPHLLNMRDLKSEDDDRRLRIWFLPEADWPDGVHVFRTKLFLEGRIDDLI